MDEQSLAQRLITYDTSRRDDLVNAAGFIKGWLDARDLEVKQLDLHGLPILVSTVGAGDLKVIFHGHLDVVPGRREQFSPWIEGDRLYGRGAYDMKGGLAAMLYAFSDLREQQEVQVVLAVVPDEESEDTSERASDHLVQEGFVGDFAITGEPTDMHIGIQAKGVLAMRLEVSGTAAHGATPWLGDNAVLKAVDAFRAIESLAFTGDRSDLLGQPSVNLGRILGGDALNKVPDTCVVDVDVRYLPEQDPAQIVKEVRALPDVQIASVFARKPASVARDNPFVEVLREACVPHADHDVVSVGRDGASDAISFIEAGVPAVEFGPHGGGHHGPGEWVSISSLASYRQALVGFVHLLPQRIGGNDRTIA